jgi:pyrimidine deaminase RibD-like protein
MNNPNPHDERYFMELAVEEATKSIPEGDGRSHPRVGVVLVDSQSNLLAQGHRTEGRHAEYIVLEEVLHQHFV